MKISVYSFDEYWCEPKSAAAHRADQMVHFSQKDPSSAGKLSALGLRFVCIVLRTSGWAPGPILGPSPRSSVSNQFDFFTTWLLLSTAVAERWAPFTSDVGAASGRTGGPPFVTVRTVGQTQARANTGVDSSFLVITCLLYLGSNGLPECL